MKMDKTLFISNIKLGEKDEGIKIFFNMLYHGWPGPKDVLLHASRLFLLKLIFKKFLPYEFVIYIPTSSITIASLFRTLLYERIIPGKKFLFFSFQYRKIGFIAKIIIKLLHKTTFFLQDIENKKEISLMGKSAITIQSGVDTKRFVPVDKSIKKKIRRKWGIPTDKKVFLHVGHLTPKRGLESLLQLKNSDYYVIIIVSPAFQPNLTLKKKIEAEGIKIISHYIENIEEIYQLSDVYVFPTSSNKYAIGFPLSVLEALATGLPVITRKMGLLPMYLYSTKGIFWYSNSEELLSLAEDLPGEYEPDRLIIEDFSWETLIHEVITRSSC
jgi:glycosyltransferase involved in cell wall biosynthesis